MATGLLASGRRVYPGSDEGMPAIPVRTAALIPQVERIRHSAAEIIRGAVSIDFDSVYAAETVRPFEKRLFTCVCHQWYQFRKSLPSM